MTKIIIKTILGLSFFVGTGQVNIDVFTFKKNMRIEYENNSLVPITIDNISFLNLNDDCKTISHVNKDSYFIQSDTLFFRNDYYPSCFEGNHGNDLKLRKIVVEPSKKFVQVFRLSRCDIKKVKWVALRYFTIEEERIITYEVKKNIK